MSSKNPHVSEVPSQERHLLDNVSLMTTTLSPLGSKNNSLQPNTSPGTQGANELFRGNNTALEERDRSNISTLTAFEDQLERHLKSGQQNTQVSSTPGTAQNWMTEENERGKVKYGFDLSPVHSVENKPENSETTKGDTHESVDILTAGRLDKEGIEAAPNFMQARLASPRHLRNEKSGMNEDTETMMSQVFSSQDQSSIVKSVPSMKGESQRSKISQESIQKRTPAKTGVRHKDKSPKPTNYSKYKIPSKKPISFRQTDYSSHSRVAIQPRAGQSKSSSNSKTPAKSLRSSTTQVPPTPKSPKSRKSSIKVTHRIKSPSKPRNAPKLNTSSHDLLFDSYSKQDETLHDGSGVSSSPERRHQQQVDRTVLTHLVEDLEETKTKMRDLQTRMMSISEEKERLRSESEVFQNENDQLKKENFVLQSKITHMISRTKDEHKKDTPESKSSESEIASLKLEIAEQESLIQGYQQENERIYAKLKEEKKSNQENENAMYKENMRLKSEIANLTETLEGNVRVLKERKDFTNTGPASEKYDSKSEESLDYFKRRLKALENQNHMEEGLRKKAEASKTKLLEERDQAEKEIRILKCKQEELIANLKCQHHTERNKLQNLVAAQDASVKNKQRLNLSPILAGTDSASSRQAYLQERIRKLEGELAQRDSEKNRSVHSIQEQYNIVRSKYEERIATLEKQIEDFRENVDNKENNSIILSSLKEENAQLRVKQEENARRISEESEHMAMMKEMYEKKILDLKKVKNSPSPKRPVNSVEMVVNLQRKCEAKNEEIARLNALLLEVGDALVNRHQYKASANRRNMKSNARSGLKYNPDSFQGEGMVEVLEENKQLNAKLQNLSIDIEHKEVMTKAQLAKLEQENRALKDQHENDLKNLKGQLLTGQISKTEHTEVNEALKQRVAILEKELENVIDKMNLLKQENNECSVLKVREQALQMQIQHLLNELHETKIQSPSSTRTITILEDKFRVLEEQLRIKEESFRNALINNSGSLVQAEIARLQKEITNKNHQLIKFRTELDSILLILTELQSQGVKVPLPKYLRMLS